MKVSVIVAIYNSKEYLEECLYSLFVQTMSECEFLCIDDGSVDDSYQVVEQYCRRDSRFRLIRQENRGLAEVRNVGLRLAKGKYVAFLDGDDMFQGESALDELYEMAEESSTDFCVFDADCFYESAHLEQTAYKSDYYIRKKTYGFFRSGSELFCEMIEGNEFCVNAWILFLNREWLLKNNLWFVPRLNPEDCLFSFQCHMKAGAVKHTKKCYYRYRIRDNSLTTVPPSFEVIYGQLYTYREMLKYTLNHDLPQREEAAICELMGIILWHIKDKIQKLSGMEMHQLYELSPIDSLLLEYAGYEKPSYTQFNIGVYLEGFQGILEHASEVIIYGAGQIGRLLYHYIQRKNLSVQVSSFAVSDKSSVPGEVEGIPVYGIYEIPAGKGELLVIAVAAQYQTEMLRMAKEKGFTDIIVIDEYMRHILEQFYV